MNQVTRSEFKAIDVDYLPDIEKMIAKINRRAGRVKDLNGEFVILETSNHRKADSETTAGACSLVADVSLKFGEASTLVLNGWKLLATVERGEGDGNFVHSFGDDDGIDWSNYTHDHKPSCDACKSKRVRVKSHIIRNGDKVLEVGSKCLKLYTDGYNVTSMVKSLMQVNDTLVAHSMFGPKYGRIDTEYFIALSFEAVSRFGWSSRSKPDGEPTADRVLHAISCNNGVLRSDNKWESGYELSDVSSARAASAIKWLSTVDTSKSNYMNNIKQLGTSPTFERKYAGYVASIATAYQRAMSKKQEEEKEIATSHHLGELKQRMKFDNLVLVGCFACNGHYGATYIHRFLDADNNVLTWFSSSRDYGYELDLHEVERSRARFTGKATVKKHDEYNGVKQTVITRARFKVYVDGEKLDV